MKYFLFLILIFSFASYAGAGKTFIVNGILITPVISETPKLPKLTKLLNKNRTDMISNWLNYTNNNLGNSYGGVEYLEQIKVFKKNYLKGSVVMASTGVPKINPGDSYHAEIEFYVDDLKRKKMNGLGLLMCTGHELGHHHKAITQRIYATTPEKSADWYGVIIFNQMIKFFDFDMKIRVTNELLKSKKSNVLEDLIEYCGKNQDCIILAGGIDNFVQTVSRGQKLELGDNKCSEADFTEQYPSPNCRLSLMFESLRCGVEKQQDCSFPY